MVGHCRAGVEAIEKDKDLTADARKRKKHELARQTLEYAGACSARIMRCSPKPMRSMMR